MAVTNQDTEFQGVGRETPKFLVLQVDITGMSSVEVGELITAMMVQAEDTEAEGKVKYTIQLECVIK